MGARNTQRAVGFSLIELMIVVAIIGIIASIAIPNFLTFRCKARASEAFSILGTLKHWQMTYYAETDVFVCAADEVRPNGFDYSSAQYHVLFVSCFGTPGQSDYGFTASMESTWVGPGGGTDKWTVVNTGTLMHESDGCH